MGDISNHQIDSTALAGKEQRPSTTAVDLGPKTGLEVEKLRLEIDALALAKSQSKSTGELEKLGLEIAGLRRAQHWDRHVGRFLPIATTVIALLGLWFGVFQFNNNEKARIAQSAIDTERVWQSREKEFKRLFWEKQLATFTESVALASALSNRPNAKEAELLYRRFNNLYHGEMVLYEDPEVLDAMKGFVQIYVEYQRDPGLQGNVKHAARAFAHACRKSIASTWNIELAKLDISRF